MAISNPTPAGDPIRHVVVLMLENRSFDHVLGCFRGRDPDFTSLEGIDAAQSRSNPDASGAAIPQVAGAASFFSGTLDLPHDTRYVLPQINGGAMDGFVRACSEVNGPASVGITECMKYFAFGALPAIHALGDAFCICDHWHASVPGPTWTNRFFMHSGTSKGKVLMPDGAFDPNFHWYDQPTIYDRLNERQVPWKIYYNDFPQSLVLVNQFTSLGNLRRYEHYSSFFEDAAGDEAQFPAYSFIEPQYFNPNPNDGHPPHNIQNSQRLIADVYNALRANDPLFDSTLLIVLYDEHGGFYDHLAPPPADPSYQPVPAYPHDPSQVDVPDDGYRFDGLGVRVPAILVSRYAPRGFRSTVFDHTSILRYLTEKWALGPLTARVAKMPSIGSVLLDTPRTDGRIPFIIHGADEGVGNPVMAPAPGDLSSGQSALLSFTRYLEQQSGTSADVTAARQSALGTASGAQASVASARLRDFLASRLS